MISATATLNATGPTAASVTNLADLVRTGLLRPAQANSLTEAVRIALNTTANPADIPLEALREIPPATLCRANRLGQTTLKVLQDLAANHGWTIGDRACA